MHILLPPSETKADLGPAAELTDRTAPVDVGALSVRGLTGTRRAVLSALVAVSRHADSGLDVLGLGPGQRDELARNVAIRLPRRRRSGRALATGAGPTHARRYGR